MVPLLLAAAPAPLFASFAEVDLTPTEPLPLGGYTQRGDHVGVFGKHPLRGRFVLLRQGSRSTLLGSLDMLTLPEGLRDRLQSKLPLGVGLFLAATHTHSAPDSQMLNPRMNFRIPGIAPYSSRWLDWYVDRISGGLKLALSQPAVPVRSLEVRQWKFVGNRSRRKIGSPDPVVTLVLINGRQALGVFAAHPTLSTPEEVEAHGDWPGAWMDRGPWIVMTGAIGNMSPVPPASGATGVERSRRYVENLVGSGDKIRKFSRNFSPKFLDFYVKINSGAARPHPEFASANKVDPGLAAMAVSRFAPPAMELSLLRLGGVTFVGLPGEPTTGVARRLRQTAAMRGVRDLIVLSHVNGWGGYMLEPEDYDAGGYEATLSFFGRTLAPRLSAALDEGLQKISSP